jgi:hypothetical protein
VNRPDIAIGEWHALFEKGDMRLPDGHVDETTMGHWDLLLSTLVDLGWQCVVQRDGVELEIGQVATGNRLFAYSDPQVLSVQPTKDLYINIFVHLPSQFDFDFCLDEIETQDDLDALTEFVRLLGNLSQRNVHLLLEGSKLSFGTYLIDADEFVFLRPNAAAVEPSFVMSLRAEAFSATISSESRSLIILRAHIRQLKSKERSFRRFLDDASLLLDCQSLLPEFWRDQARESWLELDTSFSLAIDQPGAMPNLTDYPAVETVFEFSRIIDEGILRLSLLAGPLHWFSFVDPLHGTKEIDDLFPIGQELQGVIACEAPFGFLVDIDIPYLALIHKPEPAFANEIRLGDVVEVAVVGRRGSQVWLKMRSPSAATRGEFRND